MGNVTVDGVVPAMDAAWDRALTRLAAQFESTGSSVVLAAVDGAGARLPLYRPIAVAAAVEAALLHIAAATPNQKEEGKPGSVALSSFLAKAAESLSESEASAEAASFTFLRFTSLEP